MARRALPPHSRQTVSVGTSDIEYRASYRHPAEHWNE